MKYYFPTTTLNFSSILSSQRILPCDYYCEGALWWNRFEKVFPLDDGTLLLMTRFPRWEINDPNRDNYPMVVAFDGCPIPSKLRVDLTLDNAGKKLKVSLTRAPIEFSAEDILLGKVEFLFRSEEEKRRILLKAESGTDECKVLSTIMLSIPQAFKVIGRVKDEIRLPLSDSSMRQIEDAIQVMTPDAGTCAKVLREERIRGARLGYDLGRYVLSLRRGTFADAFRNPLYFEDWQENILPSPFREWLDRILDRGAVPWDPNRSGVLDFLSICDADCEGRKGLTEEFRKTFATLKGHWASADVRFKISVIEDPYLQAFSAFLECGAISGKYPMYLKSEKLKAPEYMLCLYGALVGYTSFSRTLLANDNYLPAPKAEVVDDKVQHGNAKLKDGEMEKEPQTGVQEEYRSCPPVAEPTKQQVLGKQKKSEMVQEELFDSPAATEGRPSTSRPAPLELPADYRQLITDPNLASDVVDYARKSLSFSREAQDAIKRDIEFLQKEYAPGGRYARSPEVNPPDNASTIRHLINLVNKKTPLSDPQKKSLNGFLSERYT